MKQQSLLSLCPILCRAGWAAATLQEEAVLSIPEQSSIKGDMEADMRISQSPDEEGESTALLACKGRAVPACLAALFTALVL